MSKKPKATPEKPNAWAEFQKAAILPKPGPLIMLKASDLAPHPLLDRVAMRPALIERMEKLRHYKDAAGEERLSWEAFCEDVKTRGVKEPLRVCRSGKNWLLLDGRHRWEAARLAGQSVPCFEDAEADAKAVILGAITHRKKMTAAAIAYMWVMMHPHLAVEAKVGRPKEEKLCNFAQLTREEVVKASGVSQRTVAEACSTYQVLNGKPKERAYFEPLILSGHVDLGAARAGIPGANNGGKGGEAATDWFGRHLAAIENLSHWTKGFDKLQPEEKAELAKRCAQKAAAWPDEFRALLAESIAAAANGKGGANV